MTDSDPLTDIDILAYVDGQLDNAPQRKAAVEAMIAESPHEQARVAAYRRQTEALRQAYGDRIADPVPERLLRSVNARPRRVPRGRIAAAASVAAVMLAGYTGWTVAQWQSNPGWSAQALLEETYRDLASRQGPRAAAPATAASAPARGRIGTVAAGSAIGRLSDEISLTVRAPDLGDLGYEIVARESIAQGGNETVRLTYAGPSGEAVHLYLSPRWDERESEPQVTRRGDISMGYWVNGPLAAAVASRLPPEEMRALAERFRKAMAESGPATPKLQLPRGLEQEATLHGDSVRPASPEIAVDDPVRPDGRD